MRGNLRSYWAAILAVVSARTSGEGSAIRRTTSCWERLPVISLSVRPQQTREFRRQQAHTAPQAADYRKPALIPDRKSVVEGKGVSGRVDLGGRRTIKKK